MGRGAASGGPADGRSLAIVDLDGVLADVSHRLHHLGARPKDWEPFFRAAAADPPLPEGFRRTHELADLHEVVYLTGRPERTRRLTEAWLSRHGAPPGRLLMRPDGDHRPARMFKREALRQLGSDRTVAVVVDDDPEVVALLSADGWPVELAAWLPYADPLARAQEDDGRT